MSLTVELFRANPVPCPEDEYEKGGEYSCGFRCSVSEGPYSPLRRDSTNNIYVILAPDRLSFGTASLLAAACCIPAILSLVSMWDKILKTNWRKRFGHADSWDLNKTLPGTNAATPAKMARTEDRIRFYLSMVEIPVFGAAVIAILIVGERNFFSESVRYQTEPMASIGKQLTLNHWGSPWPSNSSLNKILRSAGQWAPIVGTGLAALGSLYGLLAADTKDEGQISALRATHRNGSHPHYSNDCESIISQTQAPPEVSQVQVLTRHYEFTAASSGQDQGLNPDTSRRATVPETRRQPEDRNDTHLSRSQTTVTADGNRKKVEVAFEWFGKKLGTPAPDAFDDSEFQAGLAANWPEVPAEAQRNPRLPHFIALYDPPRDSQGLATPNTVLHRERSRAGSFTGSTRSGPETEGASAEDRPSPSGPEISPGEGPVYKTNTLEVPRPVIHPSSSLASV